MQSCAVVVGAVGLVHAAAIAASASRIITVRMGSPHVGEQRLVTLYTAGMRAAHQRLSARALNLDSSRG